LKKNCDIFISFIHEERQIARAIQSLLQRDFPQRNTFISDDIEPGEDWMREIRQAIQSAKVVILMLSPKSVGRPKAGASIKLPTCS
jgi:predicted nucleotide-binding protein